MTNASLTDITQPNLAFGPRDVKRPINWLPPAIILAVFIFDLVTPRGLLAAAFYVLAPAACLWAPHALMSRRMALITSALIALCYIINRDIGVPHWISLTNAAIAFILVWSLTWMVGLRNRHVRALATLTAEVRALRARLDEAEAAACAEVSRRLHESIAQDLTVVGWGLDDIRTRLHDPTRIEATVIRLRELVGNAQQVIMRLAVDLRRTIVSRATAPAETRAQVARFNLWTGIRTELYGERLLSELSDEGADLAFRAIKEGLTNIGKHSYALNAKVELAKVGGTIQIEVTDDGRGFAEADLTKSTSLGLIGLRERLQAMGGSLRLENIVPSGVRMIMVIQLAPHQG